MANSTTICVADVHVLVSAKLTDMSRLIAATVFHLLQLPKIMHETFIKLNMLILPHARDVTITYGTRQKMFQINGLIQIQILVRLHDSIGEDDVTSISSSTILIENRPLPSGFDHLFAHASQGYSNTIRLSCKIVQ